jgi:molecular chaperone DnaK (HSP70)
MLQFTLMVGGSTYIPYVRSRVEEVLQIPANCEIDPTTAVAIGAAYYAATKPKEISKTTTKKNFNFYKGILQQSIKRKRRIICCKSYW